jgi:L-ascorbate metabolism protein UlaG (beta-lactamase superfamily)
VTDPHDGRSIGIPAPTVTADIILVSHNHYDHNSVKSVEKDTSKVITDERKRTISDIQIMGIPAYHDAAHGERRGAMVLYKFISDEVTFCHLGDLGHELDEKTIQQIGKIDILFIPVGGNYTIDAEQAWRVVQALKPKITIPMHYRIEGLSIPVAGVDSFLERNKYKVLKVGNEIDIEKDELPKDPEVWVFTL